MGYATEEAQLEIEKLQSQANQEPSKPIEQEIKAVNTFKSSVQINQYILDLNKSLMDPSYVINEFNSSSISIPCNVCFKDAFIRNCFVEIPYFKELIISCFSCDNCNSKYVDVKGGGGMSEKGRRIELKVQNKFDLNRDLFKSETAKILIKELDFETGSGSLTSSFTTVEGLVKNLVESLENSPFTFGDSDDKVKMEAFLESLNKLLETCEFTLVIDDPLANSFIFALDGDKPDDQLEILDYERTWEQNEEFGINDMKTENY